MGVLLALTVASCDFAKKTEGSSEAVVLTGDAGFDEAIAQENKVVLVDFSAEWCGPCKSLSPKLNKVTGEHKGKVSLVVVDVDENPELAEKLGVSSIPDVRIFIDGRQTGKFIGDIPESRLRKLVEAQVESLGDGAESSETSGTTQEGEASGSEIKPMSEDWMPPGIEKRQ